MSPAAGVCLDWSEVGGDPAPGDPYGISVLSSNLAEVATAAADVRRRLVSLRDETSDAIWSGDSADAFRDRIDKLPIRLEKLHNSYDKASDGLAVYGRTLEQLQADAAAALARYQQAKSEQAAASAQQSSWQPPAPEVDPTTGVPLPAMGPPPANPHDASVSAAASALRSALDDIEDVRTRQRSAEETCVGELDEAGSIGERNDSGWKKFLAKASTVLKVVGVALLVIAVIAVVVLSGGTAAGFLAACATVFGSGLGTAMTVAGGAALAVDVTRKVRGDEGAPSWKSLVFDAALTVGPGALTKGAKYLSGADDAVRGGSTLAKGGKTLQETAEGTGLAANRARGSLGEAYVLRKVRKLPNTDRVYTQITVQTANGARPRLDLYVVTTSGPNYFVEVKTGGAGLTKVQARGFPQITSQGFVPRGARAADAGLKVGAHHPPLEVQVTRVPWPIPTSMSGPPTGLGTVPVTVDNFESDLLESGKVGG